MNSTSLIRLAAVTAATGLASLTLCAPAEAMRVRDPDDGTIITPASRSAATSPAPEPPGTDWTLVAGGGGLVVVGAGAALAGRRRHLAHPAHPAHPA